MVLQEGFLSGGVSSAARWTPDQLCQAVAELQYATATRTDGLANYQHPMYIALSLALDTAIATTYGQHVETWGPDFQRAVREIFSDCGETIAYCVELTVDYLIDRDRMAAEALTEGRVAMYVNAAMQAGPESYWVKHLATYYRTEQLTLPYGPSSLLHSILAGDVACACGLTHAGDRRAAAQFSVDSAGNPTGPDVSREDSPGAHPQAGGLPTTMDRQATDRTPLTHERRQHPRGQ
jgi:hypothetical protein